MIVEQKRGGRAAECGLWGSGMVLGAALLALAACSDSGDETDVPDAAGRSSVGGVTMGGQQPVVGSTVTLYAAGSGGYGQASALAPTALSDASGNWHITFDCPAAGTQIYAVATGGDAGGGVNPAVGLSAVLGTCGDGGSLLSNVNINEVSTVASVYALAQFLDATGRQPGTSAGNAVGLDNAVLTVDNLADVAAGTAREELPNGTPGLTPAATINTLANILAACVNSSGPDSSACTTLFTAATPPEGSAPTDTLQATLNIARNPGNHVEDLYSLAGAAIQFEPFLESAPNDWTLLVKFRHLEFQRTADLAVDAVGALWLVNNVSAAELNAGLGSISRVASNGRLYDGSPYFADETNRPQSVAVDAAGNVWVANAGGNAGNGSLSRFDMDGQALAPADGYVGGGIKLPSSLAVDSEGVSVWAANSDGSLTRMAPEGSDFAGTRVALEGISTGVSALALDDAGNIWASLYFARQVIQHAPDGSAIAGSPYSVSPVGSNPGAVATAPEGAVWVANTGSEFTPGSLGKLDDSGEQAPGSPFNAGGVAPYGDSLAVDGAGNVWVSNFVGENDALVGSVTRLTAEGVATPGLPLAKGLISTPVALTLDASGNVWVLESQGQSGVLTQLVGLAVPVERPLRSSAKPTP